MVGLSGVGFKLSLDVSGGAFAGARSWTDVSQWTLASSEGVAGQPIQITWGRNDWMSDVSPSSLSALLNNSDGRFTPDLATGAYYPHVKRRAPLQLAATSAYTGGLTIVDNGDGTSTATAAWGITEDMTNQVGSITVGTVTDNGDQTNTLSDAATVLPLFTGVTDTFTPAYTADWFPVCGVSATDLLGRAASDLPLRNLFSEEVLVDSPTGFWPLDDPGPTGGDLTGANQPIRSVTSDTNLVQWQNSTGTADTSIVGVHLGGAGAGLRFAQPVTTNCLEFYLSTKSLASSYLMVASNGDYVPIINGYVGNVFVADGKPHQIRWILGGPAPVGAVYAAQVLVDGASAGAATAVVPWKSIGVNLLGTVWGVATYSTVPATARFTDHLLACTTGFAGESTDTHFNRLTSYRANFGTATDPGMGAMGVHNTAGSSVQTALYETGDVEGGVVYADGSGRFTLRSRSRLFNPAVTVTVNAADPSVQFSSDMQFTVNDATINPPDGANMRYFNPTAVLNDGTAAVTIPIPIDTDEHALEMAGWIVSTGTGGVTACPQLDINLLAVSDPAVVLAVLALAPLDVIKLTNKPPNAPSDTFMVQGGTLTVGPSQFTASLFCTALPPAVVAVDGDGAHGVGSTAILAY